MGGLSFFDFIFNVCRSFSDVLHICSYLLLVIVAIIVAIYKFDVKMYNRYVYIPLLRLLVRKENIRVIKLNEHGRRAQRRYKLILWIPGSNRLPYYVKAVKDFFKKF